MNRPLFIILLPLLLAAHGCDMEAPVMPSGSVVKVGFIGPQTGSDFVYGEDTLQGVMTAHTLQPLLANGDRVEIIQASSGHDAASIQAAMRGLVDEDGVVAVDARIVVAPPETSTARYGHMAIHPYPTELETSWQLPDGTDICLRPIRPEDAEIEQDFVQNLSPESKYFRFMQSMEKLTPLMLARFTQIDYDREMALVGVINEHTPEARILGVARYVSNPDKQSCEFALTVADDWQKRGIGRQLMQRLMTVARDRGIEIMEGEVLSNNSKMLRLCERLGFRAARNADEPDIVTVRRHL